MIVPGVGSIGGFWYEPSSAYISIIRAAGDPASADADGLAAASADGDAAADAGSDAATDGAVEAGAVTPPTDPAGDEAVFEHAANSTAASAAAENRPRERGDPLMQPPGGAPPRGRGCRRARSTPGYVKRRLERSEQEVADS